MWEKIAESAEFKKLISLKAKIIIPLVVISLLYYAALPLSVGYLDFMKTKVIGSINLAYLFALSQFFFAWAVAAIYSYGANNKIDPLAEKIKNENAAAR